MVSCPYCQSENLPQARFCQACGRLIEHLLAEAREAEAKQALVAHDEEQQDGEQQGEELEDEEHEQEQRPDDEEPEDEEHEHEHEHEHDDPYLERAVNADTDQEHEDEFLRDVARARRLRIGGAIGLVVTAAVVLIAHLVGRHEKAPATPPVAAAPAPAPVVVDAATAVEDAAPVVLDAATVPVAPEPAPVEKRKAAARDESAERAVREEERPARGAKAEREPAATRTESAVRAGFSGKSGASAAMKSVARQHEDELYDCLVSAAPSSLRGPARVSVRLTLGSEGRASEVSVTSNNSGSEELATCIVHCIGEWSFPSSAAGDVTVTHTFVLKAQ